MNIPDCYFLTEQEKQEVLNSLENLIREGKIDSKMVPWLRRFNTLPGIVTQYCCEGHPGETVNHGSGNLLIRLSAEAFNKIYINNIPRMSEIEHSFLEFRTLPYDQGTYCRIASRFHYTTRGATLCRLYKALKRRLK